jgi:hypothetical protein
MSGPFEISSDRTKAEEVNGNLLRPWPLLRRPARLGGTGPFAAYQLTNGEAVVLVAKGMATFLVEDGYGRFLSRTNNSVAPTIDPTSNARHTIASPASNRTARMAAAQ